MMSESWGNWRVAFSDMVVGYGCSILNDFQAAEDAAQEVFLEALRNLSA